MDNILFRFKIKELLFETKEYKRTGVVKDLQEVAKDVNISRSTISRLVNGTKNANLKHLHTLLEYFDLDVTETGKLLQIITPQKPSPKKGLLGCLKK